MLSAPERSEFEEAGVLVELVGEAGDAIRMDLSALPAISPNAHPTPRLMIAPGLYQAA